MASNGKVALVTGAGSGIARAAALALLREGYSVVLTGRRQDMLEQTLSQAGPHAEGARPPDRRPEIHRREGRTHRDAWNAAWLAADRTRV